MKQKITLNELLGLSPIETYMGYCKLNNRLYDGDGTDPFEVYIKDPDAINNNWMLHHNGTTNFRYFPVGKDIALNFVRVFDKKNIWLLTSIKHISKRLNVKDAIGYEAQEIPGYSKYFGRVLIKYDKDNQNPRVPYSKIAESRVIAVLPENCDLKKVIGAILNIEEEKVNE